MNQAKGKPDLNVITRIRLLNPGLYIFRYVSPHPSMQTPPVALQTTPLGVGTVDFFPGEGVSRNTLRETGHCIIARVKGGEAGVLMVEYQTSQTADNKVVVLVDEIDTSERLLQRPEFAQHARTTPAFAPSTTPAPQDRFAPSHVFSSPTAHTPVPHPTAADTPASVAILQLQGHLERQGDVSVRDQWLGHPNGFARIEGFAIHWENRPEDVNLVYTCHSPVMGQSPPVLSGGFAGTRGQAAPITSVSFALVGSGAERYRLTGEVVFAGSAPQPVHSGLKLCGPQEREPLVALRLRITPANSGEATVPRSPSPWNDPEITQVFRAK